MASDMENPQVKSQEQEGEKKEFKEVTVKFGKGLVGEPFQGKDGKDYRQIKIPNQDENDKSPWATFVVKANSVHEDQFGKGMWVKLPAEGSTTVRKDNVVGQDEAGKNVYETTKEKVPNKELKARVEFYKDKDKDRDSLKDRLSDKKETVSQNKGDKPKQNSHLKNKDLLVKMLINVLCAIYWWNPFVYLLKKDINQTLEIRCDDLVIKEILPNQRADYLSVLLKEFQEITEESQLRKYRNFVSQFRDFYSGELLERFKIVSLRNDKKYWQNVIVTYVIAIIMG